MKGLPSKKVNEADFNSFASTVTDGLAQTLKAIGQLTTAITVLLPKQEEVTDHGFTMEDARSTKDKDYETALTTLMNQVATRGPKLVTISGRYGAETHNMDEMAANTIMNIQREKKLYRTKIG
mgnify:CR=1 FL=1